LGAGQICYLQLLRLLLLLLLCLHLLPRGQLRSS